MWSTPSFLSAFRRVTDELVGTVERKNADYAGAGDPFHNFMLIEALSKGRLSAEDGLLVRLTDKFSRLCNLVQADPQVVGESFDDTCNDMAAYAIILGLLRRSRTEPDAEAAPAATPTPEQLSAIERLKVFLTGLGGAE